MSNVWSLLPYLVHLPSPSFDSSFHKLIANIKNTPRWRISNLYFETIQHVETGIPLALNRVQRNLISIKGLREEVVEVHNGGRRNCGKDGGGSRKRKWATRLEKIWPPKAWILELGTLVTPADGVKWSVLHIRKCSKHNILSPCWHGYKVAPTYEKWVK